MSPNRTTGNDEAGQVPANCKAAVFRGPGSDLALETFDIPQLDAGEILVQMECCTLCGSDLHTVLGKRNEPTPTILGHESIGTVALLGEGTVRDAEGQALQPGDRVTWAVAVGCGDCERCQRGLPQKCHQLTKYGHARAAGRMALSGGLAQYIVLRRNTTLVKVHELPSETACPASCATATVAAGYRKVGAAAGRNVLIIGAGMLGITAAAMAATAKANSITVVDKLPARVELASRFGATTGVSWDGKLESLADSLKSSSRINKFDIVLELSGASSACAAAIELADVGSSVCFMGAVKPTDAFPLDPEMIVRGLISVHGIHNYAPEDLVTAVRFLDRHHHQFPFAELVDRSYSLDEINEAFQYSINCHPVRVAVFPN